MFHSKQNTRTQKNPQVTTPGGGGGGPRQNVNAEGVYSNSRVVHASASLVGVLANVLTKDGSIYQGILKTFSQDVRLFSDESSLNGQFVIAFWTSISIIIFSFLSLSLIFSQYDIVLETVVKLSNDEPTPDSDQHINDLLNSLLSDNTLTDIMIFKLNDVVTVNFYNVDLDYASKGNFTDTEISGFDEAVLRQPKDLVPWEGGGDEIDLSLEGGADRRNKTQSNGWDAEDMFRMNEEKYNIASTYSDNLEGYTVQLNRNTAEYREIEAQAKEIAGQIENDQTSRNRAALEDSCETDDVNEEEKFSAVVRPQQNPLHPSSSAHPSSSSSSSMGYNPPIRRLTKPLVSGNSNMGLSRGGGGPPNKSDYGSSNLRSSMQHGGGHQPQHGYDHSGYGPSSNYYNHPSSNYQHDMRGSKQIGGSGPPGGLGPHGRGARLEMSKNEEKYNSSGPSSYIREAEGDRDYYRQTRGSSGGQPVIQLPPRSHQNQSSATRRTGPTVTQPPSLQKKPRQETAGELKKFSSNFNLGNSSETAKETTSVSSTHVTKPSSPTKSDQSNVTPPKAVAVSSKMESTPDSSKENSRKEMNLDPKHGEISPVKAYSDSSKDISLNSKETLTTTGGETTAISTEPATSNRNEKSSDLTSNITAKVADAANVVDAASEHLESLSLSEQTFVSAEIHHPDPTSSPASTTADASEGGSAHNDDDKMSKKFTLNPNAKEFVLNPTAKPFTPKFTPSYHQQPALSQHQPPLPPPQAAVQPMHHHLQTAAVIHAGQQVPGPHPMASAAMAAGPPGQLGLQPQLPPHSAAMLAAHPSHHSMRMSSPVVTFSPPFFNQALQFAPMPNHPPPIHHNYPVAVAAAAAAAGQPPSHPTAHSHLQHGHVPPHHQPYILQQTGQPIGGPPPPHSSAGQSNAPGSMQAANAAYVQASLHQQQQQGQQLTPGNNSGYTSK